MSLFFSFILFFIIIFLLVNFTSNYEDRKYAYKLTFGALFLYSFFVSVVYIAFNEFSLLTLYPDQGHFYTESQNLGNYSSIFQIFKDCFINNIYVEQQASYFVFGTIAYIAKNIFDDNSVLLQMIHVAFVTSLIPFFVFKTLSNFVKSDVAFKYAFYYLLFSHIFFYSPWILRDMHIALLYSIALSILFSKFKYINLIKLFILIVITSYFRFEHGIFMLFMPFLYFYEQINKNKFLRILYFLILFVFIIGLMSLIAQYYDEIFGVLAHYSDYTSDSLLGQTGIGTMLYKLPNGIKEISIVVYSQIASFPPWLMIENAKDLSQYIVGFVFLLPPLFWFYVNFIIVVRLFSYSYRKEIPKLLVLASIFFLFFLFFNTSNMNVRRLMCMYPISYTMFVLFQSKTSEFKIKKIRYKVVFFYFLLCFFYLLLKY